MMKGRVAGRGCVCGCVCVCVYVCVWGGLGSKVKKGGWGGMMVEQRTTGSEVRGHTLVADHQVCQTLKEDKSTVSTAKAHGRNVFVCKCTAGLVRSRLCVCVQVCGLVLPFFIIIAEG